MSDDDDRMHWWDDDDWIENLVQIIRDLVRDPVSATFSHLQQFADEIIRELRKLGTTRKLDLRVLESTARAYDFTALPAASLFALTALIERSSRVDAAQFPKGFLAEVPLGQLSSILRPKPGQLRSPDIVGLLKLAARQAGKADVFEGLDVDTVANHVSQGALRTLSLSDLRATLEAISASGLLKKSG